MFDPFVFLHIFVATFNPQNYDYVYSINPRCLLMY